jgi:3D (Asp-Asp-Asp) domain-containing protein
MGFSLQDASTETKVSTALSNGTGTVTSTGIDLKNGANGDFLANCELKITIPPLTVVQLPNSKTVIADIYHDTDPAFGTETLLADNVLTVTGVTAVDPSLQTSVNYRFPVDVKRYVRVKYTQNDTSANASAVSAIAQLVF